MTEKETPPVPLSDAEKALVQQIADRDGISLEEAATQLVQAALARRVRRRTGKGPGKVYQMPRKS